jgi:hypothetical protein
MSVIVVVPGKYFSAVHQGLLILASVHASAKLVGNNEALIPVCSVTSPSVLTRQLD